jgi:glucokinase
VNTIAAIEIGGTHVAAALVDVDTWTMPEPARRSRLEADGDAEHLLQTIAELASPLTTRATLWGVAIPDPFDYERGIALYEGVGKFEALFGLDVRAELQQRLGVQNTFVFLNDADAFTIGEWPRGAATGARRCAGITLGTGVGSGWIVDGRPVTSGPGIPPGGRIHRLSIDGRPLEDTMSRRAILAAYRQAGGPDRSDVRDIAATARTGDPAAVGALRAALTALGRAVGPAARDFRADVLVIGGSMAQSWDLFEPWFRLGAGGDLPPIRVAMHEASSGLIGAAVRAKDLRTSS